LDIYSARLSTQEFLSKVDDVINCSDNSRFGRSQEGIRPKHPDRINTRRGCRTDQREIRTDQGARKMLLDRAGKITGVSQAQSSISADQTRDKSPMRIVLGIRETQTVAHEIDAADHRVDFIQHRIIRPDARVNDANDDARSGEIPCIKLPNVQTRVAQHTPGSGE